MRPSARSCEWFLMLLHRARIGSWSNSARSRTLAPARANSMHTERPFLWKTLQSFARILSTHFFDLKVFGLHHVPSRGGVLIVSNHQSSLDPVVLAVRLRRPVNYLAKSELFEYR